MSNGRFWLKEFLPFVYAIVVMMIVISVLLGVGLMTGHVTRAGQESPKPQLEVIDDICFVKGEPQIIDILSSSNGVHLVDYINLERKLVKLYGDGSKRELYALPDQLICD